MSLKDPAAADEDDLYPVRETVCRVVSGFTLASWPESSPGSWKPSSGNRGEWVISLKKLVICGHVRMDSYFGSSSTT